MKVKNLELYNIRIYKNKLFKFHDNLNILIGKNGVGKTSVLEAIYMLDTGSSFRTTKVEEVIDFDEKIEVGFIKSIVENREGDKQLDIFLTKGFFKNKKTRKIFFNINKVRRLKKFFIKNIATVIFKPEDLKLINGSPANRRSFLDDIFISFDFEYQQILKKYKDVLKRKNKILQDIKQFGTYSKVLNFYNEQQIYLAQKIIQKRQVFFDFLKNLNIKEFQFDVLYIPNKLDSDLDEKFKKEKLVGRTLYGPQRDDFDVFFKQNNKSVITFGSRGQQRLAVLFLKYAQILFLKTMLEEKPILLLDDILSELDIDMQKKVLNIVRGFQTFITFVDERYFDLTKSIFDEDFNIFHL